jgi:hypothetical protein
LNFQISKLRKAVPEIALKFVVAVGTQAMETITAARLGKVSDLTMQYKMVVLRPGIRLSIP